MKTFIQIKNIIIIGLILFIKAKEDKKLNIQENNLNLNLEDKVQNDSEILTAEGELFEYICFQGEEKNFILNFSNYTNTSIKINVEIMIFVGNIKVIKNLPKGYYEENYIGNKIYLSINVNGSSYNNSLFSIKGLVTSYYTIEFTTLENDQTNSLTKNLQLGISYLIAFEGKYISLNFNDSDYNNNEALLFSFYSLNCKVSPSYLDEDGKEIKATKVEPYDYLNNYIFVQNPQNNNKINEFKFNFEVTEEDPCDYDRKLCKFYASAVKLNETNNTTNSSINNKSSILLPDNTPQDFMFNEQNSTTISFRYMHIDVLSDLVIQFYPKHPAQYNVAIYYDGKKRDKEELIVAKDILNLDHREWNATNLITNKKYFCNIIFNITLVNHTEINSILQLSIKSLSMTTVSYIQKSILNLDYTQNDRSQYYYTELGEDEDGFIAAYFLRSSGFVYARIINRTENDAEIEEENAYWRGKYALPDKNANLSRNNFNKILEFSSSNNDCSSGCYLLINVMAKEETTNLTIIKNYPFSIIVQHKTNEKLRNVPEINIPIGEYVVGTIGMLKTHDFYSIYLTSEANGVLIDFQSEKGCLYVHVGKDKPNKIHNKNIDFSFCYERDEEDTIFTISKEEIKEKTGKNQLKGLLLTISIEGRDEILPYSLNYAFAVRLDNDSEFDIIKVESDRKVLCKTKFIEEKNLYRCLYAITYDFITEKNILFVYPINQRKSNSINIYANIINQIDFEMRSEEEIKPLIPNKTHNNLTNNVYLYDFLYLVDGFKDKQYLLVSVETEEETTIELISSYYNNNTDFEIKPDTYNLIIGPNNTAITLNFPDETKKVVYLNCLGGSADISLNDKIVNYYLNGKDDILSIVSDGYNNLKLIPTSQLDEGFGIIFYINYNEEIENNYYFEQLYLNNSIYYVYNGTDFPILFLSKINMTNMNESNYYEIFFTFDLIENEDNLYEYNNENQFEVVAHIVNEKTIQALEKTPELSIDESNAIKGHYDPALKTGIIQISNKTITKQDGQKGSQYLFLVIKKKDKLKYESISLELTSTLSQSDICVANLINIFGKLDTNETERRYLIKVSNSSKYINIKFSCSNNSLSIEIEEPNGLKFEKEENGRQFYYIKKDDKDDNTLFYTLKISRNGTKNNNKINEEYFMFQYSYSNYTDNKTYISNSTLEVEKQFSSNSDKSSIIIALNPVKVNESDDSQDIYYIVRGIPNSSNIPEKESLALMFAKNQYIKEFHIPKDKNELNKKLMLNLNIPKNIKVLQVIAQISDKEKIEYVSYKLIDLESIGIYNPNEKGSKEPSENDDDEKDTKKFIISIITIGVVLSVIIGVLAYFIKVYQKKNKGLLDQVSKVSFQLERDSKLNPGDNKITATSSDESLLNE